MTDENRTIKRYEIYLCNFGRNPGSVQCGVRPVLVVQGGRFCENSPTTVVAPLTTVIKKDCLPSHVYVGDRFGLRKPSMVLMEQVRTVNRDELGMYIGTVDDGRLINMLDRSIRKTFGLWCDKPKNRNAVRCLCPACLHDYVTSGAYLIRRLDAFQKEKSSCEKCRRPGWDYIITEKRPPAQ